LNRIRLYREILLNSATPEHDGLTAQDAKELDLNICKAIHDLVSIAPSGGMQPYLSLARWLNALHTIRDHPVEIFTTNYDLLIETALEEIGVPFFDGFIGAVNPFFSPSSVEAEGSTQDACMYPPSAWTRLSKVHGSIDWHLILMPDGTSRVIRAGRTPISATDQLMIFPSRNKYAESRKLPFIAFQERLRRFLSRGEVMLLILGYSFSDEHLNEVIVDSLRLNSRLAVLASMYPQYSASDKASGYALAQTNLTALWPDHAIIGGAAGTWTNPHPDAARDRLFWDSSRSHWLLGDFRRFTTYLDTFF
jgi:SIR2-like domain